MGMVYISCLYMWGYNNDKYLDLGYFFVLVREVGGRMKIPFI